MPNLIQVHKLSLGYDELVIKEASFTFKDDDFVFITGKSGGGKSTLLKSFYGNLELFPGQLEVCGSFMRKIGNSELLELCQQIGIIFQDYRLIQECSVEKNMTLPLMIKGYSKEVYHDQASRLLKHVNLTSEVDKLPSQLSGEEQQKVVMARALAHNPKLSLCDEPTEDLDEYSSDIIWALLESARELLGTCAVVITHRIPSDLGLNHRRLNIENGNMNEIF